MDKDTKSSRFPSAILTVCREEIQNEKMEIIEGALPEDLQGHFFMLASAGFEDLASGPLCKLSHPSLNFGFTTHTTWLPRIAPRTASYRVDVREDYEALVEKKSNPEIDKLFNEEVYPHFEEGR